MQEDLFWQKHAKSNHSPHRTNLFGYLMRFQAPNSSHLTVSHSCRWILRLCTQINSLDTQVLSEVLKLQIQPHVLTVYANPLFTPSKWIFPAKPLFEVRFWIFWSSWVRRSQEDLFYQKHVKSNHSPHRTDLFGHLMRFQAPNSSHLTVSHSCRWILRLCTQINSLDTQVLSEVLKLQIQPHVLTVYANPLFTPSKWIFPAKPL